MSSQFLLSGLVGSGALAPASLDSTAKRYDGIRYISRSSKGSRVFASIIAGFRFKPARNLLFLTLSSSNESIGRVIMKDFLSWRRWYCHELKIKPFDYFCVQTSEGNNVLHLLVELSYIPFDYMCKMWDRFHKSHIVFVEKVYSKSSKLANYFVSHYLESQKGLIRHSSSKGWLFFHWRAKMLSFVRKYGYVNGICHWKFFLSSFSGHVSAFIDRFPSWMPVYYESGNHKLVDFSYNSVSFV